MTSVRGDFGILSRNERQLLSLIRRHGPLPRAVIAQHIGLSAQSVTNMTRKLIHGDLLDAGAVLRGKVGQPLTPLALSPEGAFFLGLKIGRRLVELALIDFTGRIRVHRQQVYTFPHPEHILRFARRELTDILARLPLRDRARVMGLGIAIPGKLWDWGQDMAPWQDVDLPAILTPDLPFPVFTGNDATTACAAQLVFGKQPLPRDFIHIYIAHFAGGGIVLDGALRHGPRHNAGALGSMPVSGGGQLLEQASISVLERMVGKPLPPADSGWDIPLALELEWTQKSSKALAFVALSAVALVDLPLVVIDGALPPATRARLAIATRAALSAMPAAGIDRPDVIEGDLGRSARILGAAALPLSHFFLPDGAMG
ncbi:ROK family transcriptional regulator [Paracoccus sp. JM45]|uniref:ROK family transcriptional regulator n=1 Tax=Paracoccus sp. JM45 TaxID=2283626 RepID=UPI0016020BF0|nr:ROK family transcriptional regulator [Paracoccus sp. JM45]